jgi:hypothetical protein
LRALSQIDAFNDARVAFRRFARNGERGLVAGALVGGDCLEELSNSTTTVRKSIPASYVLVASPMARTAGTASFVYSARAVGFAIER